MDDTQVAGSESCTRDVRAANGRPAEEVVADFFDAFGRHDVEAITALLCDDVIEDLPGVGAVEGINNEREFLIGLFAAFPDPGRRDAPHGLWGMSWQSRGPGGDPSPASCFKDCPRAARRSYRVLLPSSRCVTVGYGG
jgi:SnoaL-like domain